MKKRLFLLPGSLICMICIALLYAGSAAAAAGPEKPALRAIIIPKFEIGEMTGDFPGEAQLFYERYCDGCEETEIPHMPSSGHFYVNEADGVAVLAVKE